MALPDEGEKKGADPCPVTNPVLQAVSVRHDNESRLTSKVGSQGVAFYKRKEEDDEGGSGGSGDFSGRQLDVQGRQIYKLAPRAHPLCMYVGFVVQRGSKGGGTKGRDPIDGGARPGSGALWLACTWCDKTCDKTQMVQEKEEKMYEALHSC